MLTSASITLESNIFEYKYPTKNDDLFIYPFYLTIKPNEILENGQIKGISSNGNISKVRKMIYDWGDGTFDTIDLFISSDDKQKINPSYTNIIKYYNANKTDLNTKTHSINISALRFGVKDPEIYKIYLTLNKPNVYEFFGDKLELIESRMFGLDNKMLYVFEVKDSFGQLYMTSVNWENLNEDSFSLEQLNSPKRPYQFDLPFIKNKNLQNQNIEEEVILNYAE